MPPKRNPGQEPLFVTSSTGHVHEIDFSAELAPDPIAQNLHLINVLDGMNEISKLEGLVMASHSPAEAPKLQEQFGDVPAVVSNVMKKQIRLGKETRYEFARAYGMFDRINSGLQTEEEAKAEMRHAYNEFVGQYAHSRNVQARNAYRDELEGQILGLQENQTVSNHANQERPHKRTTRKDNKDRTLDSQSRLQALASDPRAGFLPTTHTEKTTVMAMLDYFDNPAYQLGVRNQTLEIAGFHTKHVADPTNAFLYKQAKENGVQAAWSKTYELGDFLMDAAKQLIVLRQLQIELHEPLYPQLTLTQAVGDDHPAYAGIARFRDLQLLRAKGFVDPSLPMSPLKPHRNEDAPELKEFERKNKIIEDQYTRTDIDPLFEARINALPQELTVNTGRLLASAAIDDAEKRAFFMVRALKDFSPATNERFLGPASRAATFVLQRYAEVVPIKAAA